MRLSAAPLVILRTAIVGTALAFAAAGCSSGAPRPKDPGREVGAATSSHDGVTATIPLGWHRVRLDDLPGAEVPLEIASFRARGGVSTICDPTQIASQIPAGGALLQILQDSGVKRRGAGAVSQASEIHQFPALRRPFHLEGSGSHECGEAYNLWFRQGGRLFQLRVWSAPSGLSSGVRARIERLIDGLHVKSSSALIASPALAARAVAPTVAVAYGPYVGVSCRRPNRTRCDRVGIDVVLKDLARTVTASIAGRRLRLGTPGLRDGVRGKDWLGYLANAGLTDRGSRLYLHQKSGAKGIWAGRPPVQMPIRITVSYEDGRRASALFPHVLLSPGWG